MSAHFPDAETLRTALSLAIRAPSVHNAQPWRWRIGDESIHLYADTTRQLIHADPDGRDLIISCGLALNHCELALAALGWQSRIHRFPDDADPTHLAAIELVPRSASELDIALAAAIPKRRTDRRLFSAWPVAHGDIGVMGARAARAGVVLRRIEANSWLKTVLAQAVWEHVSDRDYLTELATWSGRYASNAGVPAHNIPVSYSASAIPGRLFAGAALAQPEDSDPAKDRPVLLALGTVSDQPMDRLRAGEASSLVLLTATAFGLATCPVTEPLEIVETRAAIRADAFENEAYPQMLLRVGWPPINADALPATPRRPLSDVVTHLGAASG